MRKKEILKDLTMLSSILILGLVHAQLKVVAGVRILIRMEVVALPRADLLFVLDEQLILRLASGPLSRTANPSLLTRKEKKQISRARCSRVSTVFAFKDSAKLNSSLLSWVGATSAKSLTA